jgi:Arc/MetJ-type ribon-helix-helix transcriptional regulator
MTQVNIALPDDDLGWAKARVAAGEFASVDAYFSQLAKRDRAEAEEAEWLQGEIDKGLASGLDPRPSATIFSDIRAKYLGPNG